MKEMEDGGFTIIEIILFLALAGLMMLIAAQSIGSRSQRVQFTDGARATEVYLERKLSEIQNGSLDLRIDCQFDEGLGVYVFNSLPSNGDCIFLGYIFELPDYEATTFGDPVRSQITAHQVVGRRISTSQATACAEAVPSVNPILCANPTFSGLTDTFQIPWGIEVHGAYAEGDSEWSTFAFGFIRSPTSTSLTTAVFLWSQGTNSATAPNWKDPAVLRQLFDKGGQENIDPPTVGTRASFIDEGEGTHICLQSGDRGQFAEVRVADSFREQAVELIFEQNPAYAVNCQIEYLP